MTRKSNAMLGCTSHSPLIFIRPQKPSYEDDIQTLCERFQAHVDAFDPEQIVVFGNNHFAGFHYSNMPAYSIGVRCTALGDLGGTAGDLNVPAEDAVKMVAAVRASGFDPAISYKMEVDHGMSQGLTRLVGGIDRYPVIPIFISVFTPPLMPFRRSREFGEAVGRHVLESGKRTLFMASGGISHHPAFIFPPMDEASEEVLGYQTDGAHGGTMTDEEWFARYDKLHIEGAQAIVDGHLSADDLRLCEDFDRDFMARYAKGNLKSMDDWDQLGDVLPRAGMGAWEIHNWIAAGSAYTACSGVSRVDTYYQLATEYAVGYGMAASKGGFGG